jgi:hypothetical protein
MKKGVYRKLSEVLERLEELDLDPDQVLVNEDELIQQAAEEE